MSVRLGGVGREGEREFAFEMCSNAILDLFRQRAPSARELAGEIKER